MIIQIKNKDTLIAKEFKFKCSVGKRGIKKSNVKYKGLSKIIIESYLINNRG